MSLVGTNTEKVAVVQVFYSNALSLLSHRQRYWQSPAAGTPSRSRTCNGSTGLIVTGFPVSFYSKRPWDDIHWEQLLNPIFLARFFFFFFFFAKTLQQRDTCISGATFSALSSALHTYTRFATGPREWLGPSRSHRVWSWGHEREDLCTTRQWCWQSFSWRKDHSNRFHPFQYKLRSPSKLSARRVGVAPSIPGESRTAGSLVVSTQQVSSACRPENAVWCETNSPNQVLQQQAASKSACNISLVVESRCTFAGSNRPKLAATTIDHRLPAP